MHFLSTTFRDRGPQPRKQRPYFGSPKSHTTQKKHRFSRPRVFSEVNSHASKLLHFPTARQLLDDNVVDMMVWMLTMTIQEVRNSEVFKLNFLWSWRRSGCKSAVLQESQLQSSPLRRTAANKSKAFLRRLALGSKGQSQCRPSWQQNVSVMSLTSVLLFTKAHLPAVLAAISFLQWFSHTLE